MAGSNITLRLVSPTRAALAVSRQDEPAVEIPLGAADIEEIIARLAMVRSRMKPEVLRTRPVAAKRSSTSPLAAVVDVAAGKMILVRDAGFGWLSFVYKQADANKIAAGLRAKPRVPAKRTLQ